MPAVWRVVADVMPRYGCCNDALPAILFTVNTLVLCTIGLAALQLDEDPEAPLSGSMVGDAEADDSVYTPPQARRLLIRLIGASGFYAVAGAGLLLSAWYVCLQSCGSLGLALLLLALLVFGTPCAVGVAIGMSNDADGTVDGGDDAERAVVVDISGLLGVAASCTTAAFVCAWLRCQRGRVALTGTILESVSLALRQVSRIVILQTLLSVVTCVLLGVGFGALLALNDWVNAVAGDTSEAWEFVAVDVWAAASLWWICLVYAPQCPLCPRSATCPMGAKLCSSHANSNLLLCAGWPIYPT
jgi:hypothetical protein